MLTAGKKLTVSYGTFSCTLEGFDDPFTAMKAIAEYFRELAAEDSTFGSAKVTPDTKAIHDIAQREVKRRVEAEVKDGGVTLRATEAVDGNAKSDLAVAVKPDTETTGEKPAGSGSGGSSSGFSVAGLLGTTPPVEHVRRDPFVDEKPAEAEFAEPPAVWRDEAAEAVPDHKDATPATDTLDDPEAISPEDLADLEALDGASRQPKAAETAPALEVAKDTKPDEAPALKAKAPEAKPAPAKDTAPAEKAAKPKPEAPKTPAPEAAAPTSVAARLMRIRAVSADAEPSSPTSAPASDEDAASVEEAPKSEPVAETKPEPPAAKEETPEAKPSSDGDDLTRPDDADMSVDDILSRLEKRRRVNTQTIADQPLPEQPAAKPTDTQPPEPEAPAAQIPSVEEPAESAPPIPAEAEPETAALPEAEAEPTTEQEPGRKGFLARARARLLGGSDDEDEHAEAVAEGSPDTAEPEATKDTSNDPGEDTMSLLQDLAELERKAAEAEARADSGNDDSKEQKLAQAEAERARKAADERRAQFKREGGHTDSDLLRLLDKTNSQLEGIESKRRITSISHLKAAVAATVADRKMKTDKSDLANATHEQTDMDRYREDLQSAVHPKPAEPGPLAPTASGSAPEPTDDGGAETDAIAKVAAQIAEKPAAKSPEPQPEPEPEEVQPKRIISRVLSLDEDDEYAKKPEEEGFVPNPSTAQALAASRDFADFAERVGAMSLPELLEAAAAYTAAVEGRQHFSRPQLMRKIASFTGDNVNYSREEGLRSFGMLLREGKIQKLDHGQFTIAKLSKFIA